MSLDRSDFPVSDEKSTKAREHEHGSSSGGYLSPEEVWVLCEDTVKRRARSELRRHFVTGANNRVDENAVEEVCQNVVVKLLKALATGQYRAEKASDGGVLAYVSRITENEVINYVRINRSAGRVCKTFSDDGTILNLRATPEAEGLRNTAAWMQGTLGAELLKKFKLLPDPMREVVMLSYGKGLGRKAIAETLGVGLSTVHSRLTKAYRLLEKMAWSELQA